MILSTLIVLSLSYVPQQLPTFAARAGIEVVDAGIPAEVQVPASAGVTCVTAPTEHPDACAQVVLDAIVNKQWGLLVSFVLLFVIAALRKWVPETTKFGMWIRSKLGAIIFNFGIALSGAFATQFLAGLPFSFALVVKAIVVALTASGGWAILKNVKEALAEKKAQQAGTEAASSPTDTLNG